MNKYNVYRVALASLGLSLASLANADAPVDNVNQVANSSQVTAQASEQQKKEPSLVAGPLTSHQSTYDSHVKPAQPTAQDSASALHQVQLQMPAPQQSDTGLPPVVSASSEQTVSGSSTINETASQPVASSRAVAVNANQPAQIGSGGVSKTQPAVNTSQMTDQQRLSRLEQQLSNLTNMNLPQQLRDIRTQLQQLNGQLQVQQHNIELVNERQRSFYHDLDQRIKQISNTSATDSDSQPAPGVAPTTRASVQMKDADSYKSAINLLSKKNYPQATKALQRYVSDYPNGTYVVNAHYWLGEIYYLSSNYKLALNEFNKVINSSPKSQQVPGAKLKVANIYLKTNKRKDGEALLRAIKKDHPGTTAAQLANIQLQQLKINSEDDG